MGKHEKIETLLSQNTRAWLYRVALAALPLLAAYGLLDEQTLALWASFLGYFLLNGLAVANTPRTPGALPAEGEGESRGRE